MAGGFCAAALGGAPGIYSARWAGPRKDFRVAMERVHAEAGEAEDRGAWFISALCLAWPDGHYEIFEGRGQDDPDSRPGDPRVGRGPHQGDVAVPLEVEAALVEVLATLGSSPASIR